MTDLTPSNGLGSLLDQTLGADAGRTPETVERLHTALLKAGWRCEASAVPAPPGVAEILISRLTETGSRKEDRIWINSFSLAAHVREFSDDIRPGAIMSDRQLADIIAGEVRVAGAWHSVDWSGTFRVPVEALAAIRDEFDHDRRTVPCTFTDGLTVVDVIVQRVVDSVTVDEDDTTSLYITRSALAEIVLEFSDAPVGDNPLTERGLAQRVIDNIQVAGWWQQYDENLLRVGAASAERTRLAYRHDRRAGGRIVSLLRKSDGSFVRMAPPAYVRQHRAEIAARVIDQLKQVSVAKSVEAPHAAMGWTVARRHLDCLTEDFIDSGWSHADAAIVTAMVVHLKALSGCAWPRNQEIFPEATEADDQFWFSATMFDTAEAAVYIA